MEWWGTVLRGAELCGVVRNCVEGCGTVWSGGELC